MVLISKILNFFLLKDERISKFRTELNLDKKDFSEYMDIPRESYERHLKAKTLYLDSGMNSGKYRFKEKEEPENTKISQKEILNEIAKRTTKEANKLPNTINYFSF